MRSPQAVISTPIAAQALLSTWKRKFAMGTNNGRPVLVGSANGKAIPEITLINMNGSAPAESSSSVGACVLIASAWRDTSYKTETFPPCARIDLGIRTHGGPEGPVHGVCDL